MKVETLCETENAASTSKDTTVSAVSGTENISPAVNEDATKRALESAVSAMNFGNANNFTSIFSSNRPTDGKLYQPYCVYNTSLLCLKHNIHFWANYFQEVS